MKFKARYILAEGYPTIDGAGLVVYSHRNMIIKKLTLPREFRDESPKYRVVLEKVKS